MNSAEMQSRIDEFLDTCSDLPLFTDTGVRILVVPSPKHPARIELCTVIEPTTAKKDIIDQSAWTLIQEWSRRLNEYQGPWIGGGVSEVLWRLWFLKERRGRSWAKLAEWVNHTISKCVVNHVEDPARGYDAYALEILVGLGIDENEASELLQAAIEEVEAGRPPFLPGVPYDKDRIRAPLRTYASKHQSYLRKITE